MSGRRFFNMNTIKFRPFSVVARGRLVEFTRPVVMGILNITDDSFYDGGRYRDADAMMQQARRMLAEGADIIDVGASSSRPGATLLPPDEEARRLREAITLLRSELPDTLISVDTCYSVPARAAVEAGADIVNDIGGGGLDPQMFSTVAEMQVPYILMHGGEQVFSSGQCSVVSGQWSVGREPSSGEYGEDVVDRVVKYLSAKLDTLYRLGVKDVWLDPGFGFAKTMAENHELLRRLDEVTSLFREPVLVGVSRKRMIYNVLGISAQEALNGTTVLDTMALERGAAILRVHDVKEAVEAVKLINV